MTMTTKTELRCLWFYHDGGKTCETCACEKVPLMSLAVCRWCDRPFLPRGANAYCSEDCRRLAKLARDRASQRRYKAKKRLLVRAS